MSKVLIVTEAEIRNAVPLDMAAIDCMENCFRIQSTEDIIMPPIMQLDVEEKNGGVCIKSAYLPGLESFAVKISPGYYDNPKKGLPTTSGMMNLFNSDTGMLESVLLDNGYLTDVRTAAAGALSVKILATDQSDSIAVIGSGAQARYQLQAISLVRDIKAVRIWARDQDKAQQFADEISSSYKSVEVCNSAKEACHNSDIIVTTTASTSPLIQFDDLSPGTLVVAMGSDYKQKQELHVDVVGKCDRYICDRLSQVQTLGELHHAIEAGLYMTEDHFDELGDVVAGKATGRQSDEEIIVCDLTGTGTQDTAIATLARRRAQQAGTGIEI